MKRIKGSIRIMFVNSYLLTERAKANRLEEKENRKGFFFYPPNEKTKRDFFLPPKRTQDRATIKTSRNTFGTKWYTKGVRNKNAEYSLRIFPSRYILGGKTKQKGEEMTVFSSKRDAGGDGEKREGNGMVSKRGRLF